MASRTRKTYSELSELPTFHDRFEYLKLDGVVGEETFGRSRFLNQALYTSKAWRDFRDRIIIRDCGCDLGVPGYDISKYAIIHHINPLTKWEIENVADSLMDPENVITVSRRTHNAIHYGDDLMLRSDFNVERRPGDTCPWKEA